MRRFISRLCLAGILGAGAGSWVGCGDDNGSGLGEIDDGGSGESVDEDARSATAAADAHDADASIDSAAIDSSPVNTGRPETSVDSSPDSGTADTGGVDSTRTTLDSGVDATVDAGPPDTGAVVDTSVAVDTGVSDTGTVSDTGAAVDTSAVDTGVPDVGDSSAVDEGLDEGEDADVDEGFDAAVPASLIEEIQMYNPGASPSATELAFGHKDISNGAPDASYPCLDCLFNGGCLDNAFDGITDKECEDVTGVAASGAKAGTARSALCADTLACILQTNPNCAIDGDGGATTPCYGGGTGVCAQVEANGLEVDVSDTSGASARFLRIDYGAGQANVLFACAQINGCNACW